MNLKKKILEKLLLLICVICFSVSNAQEKEEQGVNFKKHQQFFLKGHSEIIGNNILSVHKSKPFDKNNVINDVLNLKYIDIDENKNTFSSSEASLKSDALNKTIKYAALYWSAVYKYEKGHKVIKNKRLIVYKGNDKREANINNILFKTPNSNNYQPITGNIIYDSFNSEDFEDTKPYVCFADVTNLLKNTKSANGSYTVGNIKATQGFVSGGCAGGWLLYVIYESEKETPKYFTTFNGFKAVKDETIDINFTGFKTPEVGEINTSLCFGVLEGDQKLKTDMCLIANPKSESYIPLFNKHRPAKNFFNGKITQYNTLFTDRIPNSSNTLGFDIAKIKVPNIDNSIITNNQTETTIRLKTKADGFNMFFVAFETEISPLFLETKTNIYALENNELESIKSVKIPNLEKGYYIISNVFSIEENANKWIRYLNTKGFNTKAYFNPKNGWSYVYVNSSEDLNTIIQEQKELSKKEEFRDSWILKINF